MGLEPPDLKSCSDNPFSPKFHPTVALVEAKHGVRVNVSEKEALRLKVVLLKAGLSAHDVSGLDK